jgi:hypothetical protein
MALGVGAYRQFRDVGWHRLADLEACLDPPHQFLFQQRNRSYPEQVSGGISAKCRSCFVLQAWSSCLRLTRQFSILRRRFMRMGTIAFVVAVLTVALCGESEARMHRACGYGQLFDYSHSSTLSPYTYVYPAANWGRFFQCHTYYGPVAVYQEDLY